MVYHINRLLSLHVDGTLDGLYRLTRQAEGYYHMKDPENFPVVTFEGVTHMQFASGAPPSNVAKNDLKPEVTDDAAHDMIATVMADFLRAQLGGAEGAGGTSAVVEELARAKLQAAQYAYERDEARSRQALAARALERASSRS